MNHKKSGPFPAACIVDNGIVVQKQDMLRLLRSLRRVGYIYRQDDEITNTGEGCVMEAFCDPQQATIVANHSLYLNAHSFDYIEIITNCTENGVETTFALVQENRCLCLTPLFEGKADKIAQLDAADLEAIVTEAIAATWDASLDNDL
ncbi:MAG: hypothetical protein DCF25_13305 [Leptolyngbya foveolarum]|uniref:Uncharacterized protein n=1 Tax=Leptolyngbya foveolarum TaxID=47253 RepID=A0A2W4W0Y8_9CYAN|nr:MAG: hypothetical protein DCF25_13305 [Leptolyngbya foveolarum]